MSEALPFGSLFAIAAMALATYLCRISGVVLMSRIRLTPRVQRGLSALPGSIVVATVLPIAVRTGPDAIGGVVAAILSMRIVKNELVALLVGLAVAAGIRAAAGL